MKSFFRALISSAKPGGADNKKKPVTADVDWIDSGIEEMRRLMSEPLNASAPKTSGDTRTSSDTDTTPALDTALRVLWGDAALPSNPADRAPAIANTNPPASESSRALPPSDVVVSVSRPAALSTLSEGRNESPITTPLAPNVYAEPPNREQTPVDRPAVGINLAMQVAEPIPAEPKIALDSADDKKLPERQPTLLTVSNVAIRVADPSSAQPKIAATAPNAATISERLPTPLTVANVTIQVVGRGAAEPEAAVDPIAATAPERPSATLDVNKISGPPRVEFPVTPPPKPTDHVAAVDTARARDITTPNQSPASVPPRDIVATMLADWPTRRSSALSALAEESKTKPIPSLLRAIVEPDIMTNTAEDRERAIVLRWILRDIRSKRSNLSPVSDHDLQDLIELGLVEIRNDAPMLTNVGLAAIS